MYYIETVLFCKRSKIHIPYFIGIVIVGPKGGKYLLDTFNSEKLILHIKGWYVLHNKMDVIMKEIGHNMGNYLVINIEYNSEKELYDKITSMYNIKKKFIRKDVKEKELQNIISNIHR